MPTNPRPLRLHSRSVVVIPARLESTRLPRKLLLRETGRSVLEHTYRSVMKAKRPLDIYIATDHEEIAREANRFGAKVIMTSAEAASGTDRVAEAAKKLLKENIADIADIIVNVQGDEPEIDASAIDLAISLLEQSPAAEMATLATPIREKDKLYDPACVKVVFDSHNRALYFSRSPIPHPREWDDSLLSAVPPLFYQHIGLYAYRREFLLSLAKLPQSALEKTEKLEQLRVLDAGNVILVGVAENPSIGIDTPADYRAFVKKLAG